MPLIILRQAVLSERIGDPRSTLYRNIRRGLFPPPIKLGARSTGWPSYEADAITAARIAGKSEDEIRALVKRLVEARADLTVRPA